MMHQAIYLDDLQPYLDNYQSFLAEKLEATIICKQYQQDTLEAVVKDLLAATIDIIVLDYHLSSILKGKDICQALRDNCFTGMIVGFSSDPHTEPLFLKAGADLFIEKPHL